MRYINSNANQDHLVIELNLSMNQNSIYALVEKGKIGYPNLINIYFDPENLSHAKELLTKSNYYQTTNIIHLLAKKDEEVHLIPYKDILYIEGINNDTFIHTSSSEYQSKEKLYELEQSLFSKKFIRISKSYIVSIQKVVKIKPTFNGKLSLVLENGTKLDVSRHYIQSFKKYLGM